MPTWLPPVLMTVVAYLLGGIPFGYLVARAKGMDIRQHGSGNIGATNVGRVLGRKYGIFCLVLDVLKGLVPVLLALWWTHAAALQPPDLLPLLAVFASVAGHVWCPYLGFKGGKGIATSAGAALAIAPLPILFSIVAWLLVLALTRIIALASIAASIALPAGAWFLYLRHWSHQPPATLAVALLLTVLGILAIIRHRSNLRRVWAGTEPRIGRKDKS